MLSGTLINVFINDISTVWLLTNTINNVSITIIIVVLIVVVIVTAVIVIIVINIVTSRAKF